LVQQGQKEMKEARKKKKAMKKKRKKAMKRMRKKAMKRKRKKAMKRKQEGRWMATKMHHVPHPGSGTHLPVASASLFAPAHSAEARSASLPAE